MNYNRKVDGLSNKVFKKARDLARRGNLPIIGKPLAEQKEKLSKYANKLILQLNDAYKKGEINEEQYNGGKYKVENGPGGELGEIITSRELGSKWLESPKKLKQSRILLISDKFYNVTLSGNTNDNQFIHLRFGTHGGLEFREDNPNGNGFPFPGNKWVEGALEIGDTVYRLGSNYTDNFKVDLDEKKNPVQMRFHGLVEKRKISVTELPVTKDKWSKKLPQSKAEENAILEFTLPLASQTKEVHSYPFLITKFEDQAFAISSPGGKIKITDPSSNKQEVLELKESIGQVEAALYNPGLKLIPGAYTFVQGQALNTVNIFRKVLTQNPKELLPILEPNTSLYEKVINVLNGNPPDEFLAHDLNIFTREKAGMDSGYRRKIAQIIANNINDASLPFKTENKTTSTQFEGKVLWEGLLGKGMNLLTSPVVDESGYLTTDGTFHSYGHENKILDYLTKIPDYIEPVAVLDNNYVKLYTEGKKDPSLLERRTVLLFDDKLKQFCIGFQEVFHEKA